MFVLSFSQLMLQKSKKAHLDSYICGHIEPGSNPLNPDRTPFNGVLHSLQRGEAATQRCLTAVSFNLAEPPPHARVDLPIGSFHSPLERRKQARFTNLDHVVCATQALSNLLQRCQRHHQLA
jgi:hypothetical protein